jgi:hypothetical protein
VTIKPKFRRLCSLLLPLALAQAWFGILTIANYRVGFEYHINQVLWFALGVPENMYGFRNMVLPGIIARVLELTSAILVALFVYDRLTRRTFRFSVSIALMFIALLSTIFAIMRGPPIESMHHPLHSAVLFAVMAISSIVFGYLLLHSREVRGGDGLPDEH